MEPVSGVNKKMSIRRCRYLAMLVLLSFLSLYCLVKWSAKVNSRNLQSAQILHEVQVHEVKTAPKEDLDADERGMYDEIELTAEDLHIAAEKRASLTKFMTGFKQTKDTFKPTVGTAKVKYHGKAPSIRDFKSNSTPKPKDLHNSPSGNKVAQTQTTGHTTVISNRDTEIQSGQIASIAKDTLQNSTGQQKFGAEILAEPSELDPPLNTINPRKAKVKHPSLPKVTSQHEAEGRRYPQKATVHTADGRPNFTNAHNAGLGHPYPPKAANLHGAEVGPNGTNRNETEVGHPFSPSITHQNAAAVKYSVSPNATKAQKATVRQPYVNPRVIKQLQHIQAVGQRLYDLQTYMQDDRIYYQFQKNRSRLGHLSEDEQQIEQEREDKILKTNSDLQDIRFPESPPAHKHGYPIIFQEANYIPSGQEHQRPSSNGAKVKEQRDDLSENGLQSTPKHQMHQTGNVMLRGDSNAVPNLQVGYPDKDGKQILKALYSDTRNSPYTNENRLYHPDKRVPQENVKRVGDSLSIDQSASSTAIPTSVQTTPLKYEQLPHGDLTIHQAPVSKDKEQTVNSIEDKVKDLGKNKDGDNHEALIVSKVFIQSMTNATNLNDTVATVQQKTLFQKPTKIHRQNSLWQVHESPQAMYLYSAYYDDRPALDRHKVRILGIANAAVKNPHCLLWYANQSNPDIAMAVLTKIGPRIQPLSSSANRYEPYIFTCAVILDKGAPKQVSVITIKETKPTTLLDVNIPVKPPPDQQLEIGQCMSVVYWNQDPTRLIEWLEVNKIWGVGEVTVYADELDDASTAVFADYADKGFVDFRQMPNILDDDSEFTILLNMSPAINDCMYRNMYRYKKVLCTDVDEMIVPRTAANYTEMMSQILAAKGSGHPHPSFMFRNVYFFTDFGPHVDEPWFLHSQRYLKHIKPSEFGYSVKSITDPQACIALQNHLCWKRIRKYDHKTWTIDVPISLGRNQHYKKCHFDSYLGQLGACDRMMKEYFVDYNIERFGAVLYDRVAQKLLQFKIADAVGPAAA